VKAPPGTYVQYPRLDGLPALVRKQRRLEAQIAPLSPLELDEKLVRGEIDRLLVEAGLAKGDFVTCLGYDVTHNSRAGTSRLNQDLLVEQLVAAGVDRVVLLATISICTEIGEPPLWATVKPSKGSKVRLPMATAGLTKRTTKNARA
jgi:hypothetical protein